MKTLDEALLEGQRSRPGLHDRYARIVINSAEFREDAEHRRDLHALLLGLPRPLTPTHRLAAAGSMARPGRVYAPASARVPKQPLPWDAELIEAGRSHTITAEAALHPGDRSDPAELR